jgi:SAM-dependent methyltransferase
VKAHDIVAPSDWVVRWAPLITRGRALDLACGAGRHARHLAGLGHEVTAVDREPQSLESIRFVQADLEDGSPWPLPGEQVAGVVVANYRHRPAFALIEGALAPGGVLIYETFMAGNERFGKPSNPAFLLAPGELWRAFGGLHIIAFEQGLSLQPKAAMVQRLCARRTRKG